jgi:uncharacterized protein (TIGR00297 family)
MNTAASLVLARLLTGLALSAFIGWLAYRRASLSRSGVLGAILTGTLIFGFGGLSGGLLLIAFFVSSSFLSHYKEARKQLVAEQFDKGGRRDLGQALANGSAATLFAVGSGVAWLATASPDVVTLCLAGLAGALATATADTWATELGVLSKSRPRLITNLTRQVEPGTSGGVTLAGTLAAVGGALFIGLAQLGLQALAAPLGLGDLFYNAAIPLPGLGIMLATFMGGLAGTLFDSLLGATVQATYYSDCRGKLTERRMERDGTPNRFARGWRWLNNDWVNFIATLAGALVALALTCLFL